MARIKSLTSKLIASYVIAVLMFITMQVLFFNFWNVSITATIAIELVFILMLFCVMYLVFQSQFIKPIRKLIVAVGTIL